MNNLKLFLTEYKTSLCGIVAGAFTAYAGGTSFHNVALSFAIAFLGLFAKDAK